MKKLLVSVLLSCLCTATARGEQLVETTCTDGSLTRTVGIAYLERLGRPPCEVRYRKPDERPGIVRLLWSARHTAGYCERKAEDLIDRLGSQGWSCARTAFGEIGRAALTRGSPPDDPFAARRDPTDGDSWLQD